MNIVYGLRNVYYARSHGLHVPKYDKPVPIQGAVSLALKSGSDFEIARSADGTPGLMFPKVQVYSGEMRFNSLPTQFRIDILNQVVENGTVCETGDGRTNEFALLCEFTCDKFNRRYVFYRCKTMFPNIESDTLADKVSVKGESLNFYVFRTLFNDGHKNYIDRYVANTPETADIYNQWFNAVYLGGKI